MGFHVSVFLYLFVYLFIYLFDTFCVVMVGLHCDTKMDTSPLSLFYSVLVYPAISGPFRQSYRGSISPMVQCIETQHVPKWKFEKRSAKYVWITLR